MFHPKRMIAFCGCGCVGIAMLAGCGPTNTYVEPPAPTMVVSPPLQESVTDYLEETGTTEAVEYVQIRARVKGFLQKICFQPGDQVQAGQILYEIEPDMYQAQLNQALAAKDAAEAQRDNAQAQYDISAPLYEKGAVTKAEMELRKATVSVAQAQIRSAEAAIQEANLNLQYCTVRSPIDGRVGKTLEYEGNLVGDGTATHLTTVIKYDPIFANFAINERDLLRLLDQREQGSEKETIELFLRRDIDEDFTFAGRVDYADLELDRTTGTYTVRGEFPNPDMRIVPGAFVRVRLKGKTTDNCLLIPESAVDMKTKSVFVVKDGVVSRRPVTVGLKLKSLVVIEDGLNPEDLVVVEGLQRARDGLAVETKTADPLVFQGDGVVIREYNRLPPESASPSLDDLEQAGTPPAAGGSVADTPAPVEAQKPVAPEASSPKPSEAIDETAPEQPAAGASETSTMPVESDSMPPERPATTPQFRRSDDPTSSKPATTGSSGASPAAATNPPPSAGS